MKKSIAMIAAIVMVGSVMSACGKSEDNNSDAGAATTTVAAAEESKAEEEESKTEESKAEETTKAAEDAPAEESKADAKDEKADESKSEDDKDAKEDKKDDDKKDKKAVSGEIGELTKAYNEKMEKNVFSMDVNVSMPMLGQDTEMKYSRNGDDLNMTANLLGMNMDIYKVGDKAVILLPDLEAYMEATPDDLESYNMDTYVLKDGAVFDGTEEKDGLTVENYTLDEEGSEYKYAYYYDDKGDLKKVIVNSDWTGEVTAEFSNLSFDAVEIKLPDTSKLEKYDQDNPSPEMGMKLMCSMFGITPEMVEKSGYTYEKLAELDEDKQMEAISKIAEENGLDMDGLLGSLMGGMSVESDDVVE